MGDLFLGTSGWNYKEWIGALYKDSKEDKLKAYSRVFDSVEIDSTFYRYPTKDMVMRWAKLTMPNFVFTAKLPQLLTHEKKLEASEDVGDDLDKFLELMRPLQECGKIGCILIQLPPSFRADKLDVLERFFRILPRDFRFAVEFRDLSWIKNETWKLLEEHDVAYTIVDEPFLPPEIVVTSNIAYFRWHGRGTRPWYNYRYKEEELKPWIPKIKEVSDKTKRVFGYFNNHYHGYAVENCIDVLEMLKIIKPLQTKAQTVVKDHLEGKRQTESANLKSFLASKEPDVKELLLAFIDEEKLKRAEQISDSEVKVEVMTNNCVEAQIREYRIALDIEKREILHNCADWDRCIGNKTLCKHVGKLMLILPEERSAEILKRLRSERADWKFG